MCLLSLGIDSRLANGGTLLTVGVHFPEFIHVISRTALDALFECFDTTADLLKYLTKKEALLTQEHVRLVGEEDLIGAYMRGRHPSGSAPLGALLETSADGVRTVQAGTWSLLQADQEFIRRKVTLAPSYLIDDVIEQVGSDYFQGKLASGQDIALAYHAAAFQVLATESRMARMLMGLAIKDVRNETPLTFWSTIVESADQPGVLYLWLIYPVVEDSISDDELEAVVGRELEEYVYVTMSKFPNSHTVFGVAIPNAQSVRTSQIFCMSGREGWSIEMQKEAESLGRVKGILSHIETTKHVVIRAI